jgi:dTDP-4-dehydrorhamnose reductase
VRILVTGAGGLLGGRLCELLAREHDVSGVIRRQGAPDGIQSRAADLTDEAAVAELLRLERPDAVIHAAALADADICEREPDRARRDNVIATTLVASACGRTGVRLIAISTDLVFDGTRALSDETATPVPRMQYGRSKLEAEVAAEATCPGAVILRAGLVCGRGHGPRRTASEALAFRLRRGEPVTLYEDEWRTPLGSDSLAHAVSAVLKRPNAKGIFHIAGAERLSRVQLGERVAAALGLDASLIRRAPQRSHEGAPRPADVSLDIARARFELGWMPGSLDDAIREGRMD